jgi:hypothetical protein
VWGRWPSWTFLAVDELVKFDSEAQPVPTAGTASPAATTTPPQPGEQQVVELYPIFDRVSRRRVMVNAERYEQERAGLGRLLRYLAKTIPADAKEVPEAYPFGEVKDMYAEVTGALTTSGQRYARGELAAAGFWAREASQFTGIEAKAHDLFLKEGMWSYVGKRVGLAVIGFFEGAAEGMVGLIDTGASLFGYHPDLEGKIAERYTQIKDAYSDAIGIDHNLTHDASIGRFGGKLAENLATGKAIGQLGRIGTVINVTGRGCWPGPGQARGCWSGTTTPSLEVPPRAGCTTRPVTVGPRSAAGPPSTATCPDRCGRGPS